MALTSTIKGALACFSPFRSTEWSSSDLRYERDDGDERIFKIIRKYLQTGTDMSKDKAWFEIVDILPAWPVTGDHHIKPFWQIVEVIAEQIPYTSTTAHARLARLVSCMMEPVLYNGRIRYPSTEEWQINMFEMSLVEYPDVEDPKRLYLNQHAHRAHISREQLDRNLRFATDALKGALEYDALEGVSESEVQPVDLELMSIRIIAAAIWIIVCGQEIYNRFVTAPPYAHPASSNAPYEPGPGFKDGTTLGVKRWQFWAQEFEKAATTAELSEEARRVSAKAAGLMRAIELSMSW